MKKVNVEYNKMMSYDHQKTTVIVKNLIEYSTPIVQGVIYSLY